MQHKHDTAKYHGAGRKDFKRYNFCQCHGAGRMTEFKKSQPGSSRPVVVVVDFLQSVE